MSVPRVILRARKARPFFARHPWVLAGSIDRIEGAIEPGAEVALHSHEGAFIARGLFNPASTIRVRLYRWEDEPLDRDYWSRLIGRAIRMRREILGWDRDGAACRLVYSESDGISGLVVDRYDRWLVAQFTSLALLGRRQELVELLLEQTGCEGLTHRTESGVAALEGLRLRPGEIPDAGRWPDGPIAINEHGLDYRVDARSGQKTGWYLDQRENRLAAARYAATRRVLDLFCYTGGFALNVLRHGHAASVLGVDSSAPAIERAREHARLNGLDSAQFEAGDVFDVVSRLREERQRFGLVVCDPPKYARQARAVDEALKGYQRINRAILDVLEPDGILVTCSCSGHVDRELFAQMLAQVSEQAGRPIQFLEQRGQSADHPVIASCLETDYLKCFICRVS